MILFFVSSHPCVGSAPSSPCSCPAATAATISGASAAAFCLPTVTATGMAELGSLKCECSDDVKKALKNAKYTPIEIDTALNEMRGGDSTYKVSWRPIAFDAVILSGLKLYTLRKSLPTGEIFTFKHKGVSKAFSSGLSSEQEKHLWFRYLNMHSKPIRGSAQWPLRSCLRCRTRP